MTPNQAILYIANSGVVTPPVVLTAWDPAQKFVNYTLSDSNHVVDNPVNSNAFGFVSTTVPIVVPIYAQLVGLNVDAAQPGYCAVGITNNIDNPGNQTVGGSNNSIGYWSDGNVYKNQSVVASRSAYYNLVSPVIGIAYNPATEKLWFELNGVFTGNPVADTGAIIQVLPGSNRFIAATLYGFNTSFRLRRPNEFTGPNAIFGAMPGFTRYG